MILLTIILGFTSLALFTLSAYRYVADYEGGFLGFLGVVVGLTWLVMFALVSNVQWSTQSLTGYIYSRDEFGGVTNYHIRFSENAGEDTQPSFCVNEDSPSKKQLDALVGTGKKVKITVPSVSWYFSNDLIHCASNAQLDSVQ